MPGPAAEARGAAAAQAVIDAHRAANGGAYPETVAINLWGLDAIKTKVCVESYLCGAEERRGGGARVGGWSGDNQYVRAEHIHNQGGCRP